MSVICLPVLSLQSTNHRNLFLISYSLLLSPHSMIPDFTRYLRTKDVCSTWATSGVPSTIAFLSFENHELFEYALLRQDHSVLSTAKSPRNFLCEHHVFSGLTHEMADLVHQKNNYVDIPFSSFIHLFTSDLSSFPVTCEYQNLASNVSPALAK